MQNNYMISLKFTLAGDILSKIKLSLLIIVLFNSSLLFADLKVNKIHFSGNKSYSESELKPLLKTKEKKLYGVNFL